MEQVEVETVRAKAVQTPFASGNGAVPRRVLWKHLADDKNLLAPPGDGVSDHPLGAAISVHFGGVDQRHPELDPKLQRGDFFVAPARVLAHPPGALTETGHGIAGGEVERWKRGRLRGELSGSLRSEARSYLLPNNGRLEQVPKLQIKAVASPRNHQQRTAVS